MVEPTETIIPPLGILDTLTSDTIDVAVPTKEIVVMPLDSCKVYPPTTLTAPILDGDWNTLLTKIIELDVDIPERLLLLDVNLKLVVVPLNLLEISSII